MGDHGAGQWPPGTPNELTGLHQHAAGAGRGCRGRKGCPSARWPPRARAARLQDVDAPPSHRGVFARTRNSTNRPLTPSPLGGAAATDVYSLASPALQAAYIHNTARLRRGASPDRARVRALPRPRVSTCRRVTGAGCYGWQETARPHGGRVCGWWRRRSARQQTPGHAQ